jgi:hypothetical protein
MVSIVLFIRRKNCSATFRTRNGISSHRLSRRRQMEREYIVIERYAKHITVILSVSFLNGEKSTCLNSRCYTGQSSTLFY